MNINYWGVVQSIRYALPALRESRGGVLVVSSMAGKVGTAGRTGYCPTKFAVNGFCESLRFEIAPLGVRLTWACPGRRRRGAVTRAAAEVVPSLHFSALPCPSTMLRGRRDYACELTPGLRCRAQGYVISEIHERYLQSTGMKRNMSKFITADEAARRMLTGFVNGEREMVMHKAGFLLPLRAAMPYWLSDCVVTRGSHPFVDGGEEQKQPSKAT
jgi:NAD(P)-dependent dehydrogenase (short-subunit alcohol dehydrogenase family)